MSSIRRVTIAPLEIGYQERIAEQLLTTSDNAGIEPPEWATYVIIEAAARFAVAWGASTGGSAGTTGHVYGPGTFVLNFNHRSSDDGLLHLCAITGTVSTYVSWAR